MPFLYGLLPEEYFQHYILLVESIYILLQDSISASDLQKASDMLKHFCIKVKVLYGARYETYNVHCLLHLTERVRDIGPLWTHSCFCFEDFNGELRNLFHGTQSIQEQIVLAVSIQQKLPELIPLLTPESSAEKLFNKMTCHSRFNMHQKEQIAENCYAIGTIKRATLTPVEHAAVEAVVGHISTVHKFQRAVIHNHMVHCKEYKRMTRRNNYTIEYSQAGALSYGHVQFFARCFLTCPNPVFCSANCVCKVPQHVAVIQKFRRNEDFIIARDQHTNASLPHIIPVFKDETMSLHVISLKQIVRLCFFIDCTHGNNTVFVGLFPNLYEKD